MGVDDFALERPEGFFAGLALGDLTLEVGPAIVVAVPDLGDRGHVDRVAGAPVAAPGQPAGLDGFPTTPRSGGVTF